ncbi:MAG: nucleotidyl transferase AbiEii/AbiGii toxin family protein [Muribaculaceae bacterium]|nr:nucleotidyl transferase AbiEii/AbiGii toxin family protein [Muribaculaceae bacterium]
MANEDRDFVFNNVAIKKGIHKALVEKDFWVCLVLDYLFTTSKFKNNITFKGGTSLSKGFNIIDRFSEDIDIILDWGLLGVKGGEPLADRSNTKQDQYNKELNEKAKTFIKSELLPDIKSGLSDILGYDVDIRVDEKDGQVLNFYYPKMYAVGALLQFIRLEIGPLAAWNPSLAVEIMSYIAEEMPNIFEQKSTQVLTVSPERTFWEKATILHREANRPIEKSMPLRYSRHYYDLYRFTETEYVKRALGNRELLGEVITFKKKFYRDSWADYDACLNGNFKLIPSDLRIPELKKDYISMREMLFGEVPVFDNIICVLRKLEQEINV